MNKLFHYATISLWMIISILFLTLTNVNAAPQSSPSCEFRDFFSSSYVALSSDSANDIKTGDFNHDGNLDLVIALFNRQSIGVLLGNGQGSFGAETRYPTDIGPAALALGDFNRDGNLDIATANRNTNNVSILLGDGQGRFNLPTNFAVGSWPLSLVTTDLNLDGKLDLAVANTSSNSVSILYGDGIGRFAPPINYAVTGTPFSIAAGDLNNDGRPDLVTVQGAHNVASVLLAQPTSSFAPAIDISVSGAPVAVGMADFNLDGKIDLAMAKSIDDGITVALGNGQGGFTLQINNTSNIGTNPNYIAIADVNADGFPDVINTNNDSFNFNLYFGTGTANLTNSGPYGSSPSPHAAAIGDFNNDGRLDVAIASFDATYVSSHLNICGPVLTFPLNSLAGGILNTPYNQTITVSGGVAPYHYSITNGNLPPGLSLGSTTGTLTGTPITAGSYTFTVKVIDAQNNSASQSFTITVAMAASTCATQPSGLIHWWPANNNALDIIGGGNGTLLNGVQYSPGKVSESWSFDGVDDDVSTPVTLNYSNGITFECWVKTTDSDGLLMADTGTTDETGMGLFVENGLIHLGFYKSTPNINNFTIHGSFIADGQFHHIVGTWTGDTTPDGAKLYVDGNVVGRDTALTTIGSTTKTINFGWIVGSRYFALAGLIDEASIYNRALTSQEIINIFNAGSNGKCTTVATPGTVGLSAATYTVDENAGSVTITIMRTNGSDGTVTISYTTSNGSAVAGTDYNAASGILTFANGETTKAFNITLLPDALSEGNETFSVALSNPTGGATLGNPSTAIITITDSSTQACQQELTMALQQIQNLQSQINTLTQQNSQLQTQITGLTQTNQALTQQNSQLQTQLSAANQTITNLNNQIVQLQGQVNTLTQQNSQLQTQLNTANQTIQSQQVQITQLQSQLDTVNQMLATCQTQLSQAQDELTKIKSPSEQIVTAKQAIQALLPTVPSNAQSNLNNALKDLTNAQLSLAVGNLERGLREIKSANQELINAANKGVNTINLQQILVQGIAVRVTKAVNDVEVLLGSSNQKVQEAKSLLQQGQSLLTQGNFKNALDAFIDALQKADSAKP